MVWPLKHKSPAADAPMTVGEAVPMADSVELEGSPVVGKAAVPPSADRGGEFEQPFLAEQVIEPPIMPVNVAVLIEGMEARLLAAFDQKLTNDHHKEAQIDRLHDELQSYKADLVAKAIRPMTSALIKVHMDAVRTIESLSEYDPSALTVDRIAALIGSFRDELETVLGEQDIEVFRSVAGSRFDPKRHNPVKTVVAPSADFSGTILQSFGPGFEKMGAVVERERVSVYSTPQLSTEITPPKLETE